VKLRDCHQYCEERMFLLGMVDVPSFVISAREAEPHERRNTMRKPAGETPLSPEHDWSRLEAMTAAEK
jgi:hypothetical protein